MSIMLLIENGPVVGATRPMGDVGESALVGVMNEVGIGETSVAGCVVKSLFGSKNSAGNEDVRLVEVGDSLGSAPVNQGMVG